MNIVAEESHTSIHEPAWRYSGLPAPRVICERYAFQGLRYLLPWGMDCLAFGARECQQSCWREQCLVVGCGARKRLERL